MKTSIKNDLLYAEISHFGAELCCLKDNDNIEYIWEGNPDIWGKHSPILFPIVGSLKNDTYHYNDNNFHLSRHGFARDMEFKLIEKQENSATFSLEFSEETLQLYPFKFELQIIYILKQNSLTIAYKVINKDELQLPFSIGGHPAFALPNRFENYSLEFEKQELLNYHLLENNLISNETQSLELNDKKTPLNYNLFKNDALIFKTLESNSLTILENDKPFLRLHFNDFPNLGIWTKLNAPFLCIEPWFGYSDTTESSGNLLDKEGIVLLDSKQTFKSIFSIEIIK